MKNRSGLRMSVTDVVTHQSKHGFGLPVGLASASGAKSAVLSQTDGERATGLGKRGAVGPNLPKPVRMSVPEREMGMILEKQKRDGEIVDYRFQGMSLAYSPDPETGIQLRYKCDWVVIVRVVKAPDGNLPIEMIADDPGIPLTGIKIIEVKGFGRHAISAAAKLRFKGAKAAWPMFQFEMHQRCQDGQWRRVL